VWWCEWAIESHPSGHGARVFVATTQKSELRRHQQRAALISESELLARLSHCMKDWVRQGFPRLPSMHNYTKIWTLCVCGGGGSCVCVRRLQHRFLGLRYRLVNKWRNYEEDLCESRKGAWVRAWILRVCHSVSCFGGLEVACWPLVPKFARSRRIFRAKKSSARRRSHVVDLRHVKDP